MAINSGVRYIGCPHERNSEVVATTSWVALVKAKLKVRLYLFMYILVRQKWLFDKEVNISNQVNNHRF